MPTNEKQPLYTASLHKKWNYHRLMHEKVGGQTTLIDPTLEKVGVSWPPWPRASAVYADGGSWWPFSRIEGVNLFQGRSPPLRDGWINPCAANVSKWAFNVVFWLCRLSYCGQLEHSVLSYCPALLSVHCYCCFCTLWAK